MNDRFNLEGKVAIITGSSKGIGDHCPRVCRKRCHGGN